MRRREYLTVVLAGTGMLAGCPALSEDGDPDDPIPTGPSPTQRPEAASGSGAVQPPAFPDDPVIVTNFGAQLLSPPDLSWGGWPGADAIEDVLPTLLAFHPDVLDFTVLFPYRDGEPLTHPFQKRAATVSTLTGIPSTSGWNPTLTLKEARAREMYDPVREEQEWTFPDGEPVEHVYDILAETLEGDRHEVSYAAGGAGIPSVFAKGTLDLITKTVRFRFGQGFSGFELDGVDIFNLHGLDFSPWARTAFSDHVASLTTQRRRELGIEGSDTFDVETYIEEADIGPGTDADPREDPVFREFVRHHHRGVKSLFGRIRADLEEAFPRRVENDTAVLWANQFTGSFHNPQQANVYASDHLDVVNTELAPDEWKPSDLAYKYLRAIGRFEKPVMAKGTLTKVGDLRGVGEFDPTRRYPTFYRLQAAEAYANGAIFKIPLTSRLPAENTVNNWVRTDGEVEPELETFMDFLWAHGRFFRGVESDNPVAVVWSLPSRIWGRFPQWNIPEQSRSAPGVNSFVGSAALLREAQIPYDVVVFGYSDLWDDADQLERLGRYQGVVLPNLLCLSDGQLQALEGYLEDGGTVVVSGSAPTRDERYRPRDDVDALLDHENTVQLEKDPGRRYESEEARDGSLVEAIEAAGIRPTVSAEVPMIAVNRLRQRDPDRLLVHLLNYDYEVQSDRIETNEDLQLRVATNGAEDLVARFYAPQTVQDLEVSAEGAHLTVTVPELVEWGFVVFADSWSAIDPLVEQADATADIERARSAVSAAQDAGAAGTLPFVVATSRLEAAETALSFGEYGAAAEAAATALRQASAAREGDD